MRFRRTMAVVMAALMVLFSLPVSVFAGEDAIQLSGELKIKGKAKTGASLSADFSKVLPEGLTDDMVTFLWSRIDHSEAEAQKTLPAEARVYTTKKELGREKSLSVTEEMQGYDILLEVTAAEDSGYEGSLYKTIGPVDETKTEDADTGDTSTEETDEDEDPEFLYDTEDSYGDPEYYGESDESYPEIPADQDNGEWDTDPYGQTMEEDSQTPSFQDDSEQMNEPDDSFYDADPDGILDITMEESYNSEDQTGAVPETTDPSADPEQFQESRKVLEVDRDKVDFGSLESGEDSSYYAEQAQVIQVTNTGDTILNFEEITPEHFMVADIEEPLLPDETVSLWIQPRTGLEPGTYTDLIAYASEEGAEASYEATVVIRDKEESFFDEDSQGEKLTPVTGPEGTEEEIIPELAEEGEYETDPEPEKDPENETDPDLGEEEPEGEEQNPQDPQTEEGAVFAFTAEVYQTLDFGSKEEGYTEAPTQSVEITNKGTVAGTLAAPYSNSGNYNVTYTAESLTVEPDASITFVISPKTGLAAGDYADQVNFYPEGTEESVLTSAVSFTVTKPEPVVAFAFTKSAFQERDFGQLEEGYKKAPAAQKVVIKNTGNTAAALAKPFSSYGYYDVTYDAESLMVEPGATITFKIRPKTGLEAGTYSDYINFYLDGAEDSILTTIASFKVTEKVIKLISVSNPADITGLKNGTAKTAESLGLPSKVTILTSEGKQKASVKWDVKNCSYQPGKKSAQTFRVTGKVTLPGSVTNPDKVSLKTSVKVSVKEYKRAPMKVSASDNLITGITPNGVYQAQEGIKFQAVGAGMDNTNPQIGDQRYLPLSCTVVKTYTWESAPYEATIRLHDAGDYTLKVIFNLQEYTKNGWKSVADSQDTKTVNFRIVNSSATPTATPTVTPAPVGKRAVATGDDTPILPMVLILVGAVVVAGAVIMIRKKK